MARTTQRDPLGPHFELQSHGAMRVVHEAAVRAPACEVGSSCELGAICIVQQQDAVSTWYRSQRPEPGYFVGAFGAFGAFGPGTSADDSEGNRPSRSLATSSAW